MKKRTVRTEEVSHEEWIRLTNEAKIVDQKMKIARIRQRILNFRLVKEHRQELARIERANRLVQERLDRDADEVDCQIAWARAQAARKQQRRLSLKRYGLLPRIRRVSARVWFSLAKQAARVDEQIALLLFVRNINMELAV